MEPDYNPSSEEQATDRLHRIGQLRDVHVHKLFIKGIVSRFFAVFHKAHLSTLKHATPDSEVEEPLAGFRRTCLIFRCLTHAL